jgi:hypothetical protein
MIGSSAALVNPLACYGLAEARRKQSAITFPRIPDIGSPSVGKKNNAHLCIEEASMIARAAGTTPVWLTTLPLSCCSILQARPNSALFPSARRVGSYICWSSEGESTRPVAKAASHRATSLTEERPILFLPGTARRCTCQ